MTKASRAQEYVLGLDLGVSSIGWALVRSGTPSKPGRIIHAGVHLFQAGVDGEQQSAETAMEVGREKSRAIPRREARQQRRQTWRRAQRKRVLLKALIQHGLLPMPTSRLGAPEDIDRYMKSLDATLRSNWDDHQNSDHRSKQLLPYRLRSDALQRQLQPVEIGRALYHLAQRRGFLSNRKTDNDANDEAKDTGKVKQGISELDGLMREAGAQTLGQYFASIDPSDPEQRRIRGRWTGRSMYEHEFNCIWKEQSPYYPGLMTQEARDRIRRAIFFQRPLKSQRNLIGRCSLFPKKRRAPIADRLFQRFRMLQKVNDLEVIPCIKQEVEDIDPITGHSKVTKRLTADPTQKKRPITSKERQSAISLLLQGDATFHQLRQAGAAPKTSRFNLESEGEKRLPGLRTDERLRAIFGGRWEKFSEDDKNAVVEDCVSFVRADAMEKRGREHWKLSADDARAFARIKLEEGYANLSRSALRRLVPEMEKGTSYSTARKKLFPQSFEATPTVDRLPPSCDALDGPVSPAVSRALSELRGVVNAIIRRYGKPAHIRIELARDLKKGRKRREAISKQMAVRRKLREAAAERLLEQYPSRGGKPEDVPAVDILKVMLANECNWICPYTGRSFCWDDVFGPQPTIEIEHIWPLSRSLDDSFINKTLCCVKENRDVKKNRLPSEAYSGDRLDSILQRVAKFKGDTAREKLDRFRTGSIPPGFTNRHLAETRYISLKAAEYLSLLYGGYSDDERRRRVHASSGGLTAWLRREWGMNSILSTQNEKERSDHRHHAVDAIVIAYTTPAAVQQLEVAAARAESKGTHRRFDGIQAPFALEDARQAISVIVVSHRQNRRVRGKFHKDSIYSKLLPAKNGSRKHRIRKEVHQLKENEIALIVDSRIGEAVMQAYHQRKNKGAKNPAQAFSEPKHRPQLPNGDRIRRVRLYTKAKPQSIGIDKNDRKQRGATKRRHVLLQANHHTIIMARLDAEGNETSWVDVPVSLFDAMDRVKGGMAAVSRQVPDGHRFKFSLAANEFIEMDLADGEGRGIYRVLSLSAGDNRFQLHADGRARDIAFKAGAYLRVSGEKLRRHNARKVHVTYLGEIKNAGG